MQEESWPSYNSVKTELKSSDDCISREDVMRILKTLYNFDDLKDLKVKQQEVMNLPSVTPTRPHGEWNLLDECANSGYYCSVCSKKLVKEGWSDTVKKIKFCPNCGAEMEVE